MSAPVLFLDFDGVLNHHRTRERFTFPPDGKGFTGIDATNVERLNRIMETVPDARIVVSSTWRLHLDLDGLRAALVGSGFKYPDRMVGVTPPWRTTHGNIVGGYPTRGDEIQAWIDGQDAAPLAVAIVDDAEDMAHLTSRLVRTDLWAGGMLDAHADAVIEKLRGDAP